MDKSMTIDRGCQGNPDWNCQVVNHQPFSLIIWGNSRVSSQSYAIQLINAIKAIMKPYCCSHSSPSRSPTSFLCSSSYPCAVRPTLLLALFAPYLPHVAPAESLILHALPALGWVCTHLWAGRDRHPSIDGCAVVAVWQPAFLSHMQQAEANLHQYTSPPASFTPVYSFCKESSSEEIFEFRRN